MATCELCELREYTQRYAQFVYPFKFTILDCDSCDTPMVVLGDHRPHATDQERALMIEALSLIARVKYGEDRYPRPTHRKMARLGRASLSKTYPGRQFIFRSLKPLRVKNRPG